MTNRYLAVLVFGAFANNLRAELPSLTSAAQDSMAVTEADALAPTRAEVSV